MRTQTMVQLTEELLEQLDARAAREGVSRSHLIRQAITELLAADRHAQDVRAFVAAYRAQPDTDEEMLAAEANARAMVAAERW